METASSLPIQIAFEPLGAGFAGLVAAGAVQAAADCRKSLTLVAKNAPILAAKNSRFAAARLVDDGLA
jgi:hypothetical protein